MLSGAWQKQLGEELQKPYMSKLFTFLADRQTSGATIYPKKESWFAALDKTPFEKVKVVILGQDPYHGAGQAHGLSFSVPTGCKTPPSLRNIYKELNTDLGMATPDHGCLTAWAEAGVLLLNSTMTVEEGEAGSHQGKGWEQFTDSVIRLLSGQREHLVFMLWGNFAQSKADLIDKDHHLILKAAHPSPFSAHRGFLGCRHFSKANTWLEKHGVAPVDWCLNSTRMTQPPLL